MGHWAWGAHAAWAWGIGLLHVCNGDGHELLGMHAEMGMGMGMGMHMWYVNGAVAVARHSVSLSKHLSQTQMSVHPTNHTPLPTNH